MAHDMHVIAIGVSDEDLEFQPGELTDILLDAINCRIGYALQVDHDMSVMPKLVMVMKFLTDQKSTDPGTVGEGVEVGDVVGQVVNRTRA
jgi:hypothetical protein